MKSVRSYSRVAMRFLRVRRARRVALVSGMVLLTSAAVARAQGPRVYAQVALPGASGGAFERVHPAASRLGNARDYGAALLLEALATARPGPSSAPRDEALYATLAGALARNPPRLLPEQAEIATTFGRLAPEAAAMFDWARLLRRQVYDVWADASLSTEQRDLRVAELLAYYRSRPAIALATTPKRTGAADARYYSLAFRRAYPKLNGWLWAAQWAEVGTLEALLSAADANQRTSRVDAVGARFGQMVAGAPTTAPYLMPRTAAVAPALARRYPDLAILLDNLGMLRSTVADVLTSREVPRSARVVEIRRALDRFRADTADTTSVAAWRQSAPSLGVENMGGATVGFAAALPTPTVARGASLADTAAAMAGMEMGAPGQAMQGMPPGADLPRAILDRMLADPVVRERVATDPVLQRMLSELPNAGGAPGTGGMRMPEMSGMDAGGGMNDMPGMSGTEMPEMAPAPLTEEQRQANEFIARLLADPTVAAQIETDPRLRRIWADPAVQRRIAEIRRRQGTLPPPAPPAPRRD